MVYLVGAGPGDPGLITHKGLELLRTCDAVVYDRLGTNELLGQVPIQCEKIYVGKQPGKHSKKQDEINQILVDTARRHTKVVRLKGGDPFVFGRGGEEVLALQEGKVPFQIVPGVSSAVSVPALAGIPVTHREISRSFHVFTGHTKEGDTESLAYIHPEEGTSIFLMGLSHLDDIVKRLMDEGQSPDTPVAVLSNGCMPNEKVVKGKLENIAHLVAKEGIFSPAVIVIGPTAEYDFKSNCAGALAGKKIGMVGTLTLQDKMRPRLEEQGAKAYSLCEMEVALTPQVAQLELELDRLEQYSWIGFTSQNSIRIFFDSVYKKGIDLRRFSGIRFAVVGSGTKEALRKYGFLADDIPEQYTTEAMAESLCKRMMPGERLLLPRALRGSNRFLEVLQQRKIDTTVIPIYDVFGRKTENWPYLMDFDVITFASASGVEAFVQELGAAEVAKWEQQRMHKPTLVGAIGDITARVLEQYGIHADIIPEQFDIEHLIEKMAKEWEI